MPMVLISVLMFGNLWIDPVDSDFFIVFIVIFFFFLYVMPHLMAKFSGYLVYEDLMKSWKRKNSRL